ncbi:uncharacterized protein LOC110816553 [Carica papaya]|uniref:uncharacterized protein LOC110816553 n=1 Tax=Carica papaya TaxID=3649 RepID=UPI000B8CEFAA|nr:uncharacterized protein LOC110816553 [Carica papaya]
MTRTDCHELFHLVRPFSSRYSTRKRITCTSFKVSHKDQCGGGCTIYRLTRFIGYYVLSWPFTYVGASLGGNTGSFLDQLMKGLGVVGTPVYSLWIEGLSLSRLVYQVFPILPLALKILWRWLLKLRES